MSAPRGKRVVAQPFAVAFSFLQKKTRVQVWLYENKNLRIEGQIIGFDEYMNLVLEDAEEFNAKSDERTHLGRVMLKGENVTLIHPVKAVA